MIQKRTLFIFFVVLLLVACGKTADQVAIVEEDEAIPTETAMLQATPEPTVQPTNTPTQMPEPTGKPTIEPTQVAEPTVSNTLSLQGAYMGQEPPGDIPEIFAPGFISTESAYEGSSTFSPDGTEFYFTKILPDGGYYVMITKLDEGQWTTPTKASFNPDIVFDGTEAMITPDGARLFFFSKRPLSGESEQSNQPNMWVTERGEDGWSEPEYFGSDMMYITQASNGTLYFTDVSGRNRFIASSQLLADGTYADPQEVEIPGQDYRYYGHPFIAPDESYLIYNTIPPDNNDMDLFVVFKMEDSSWSEPQSLGESINSDENEFLSMVSPDGNYFFFTREGNASEDIYWVSAEIIEQLRP